MTDLETRLTAALHADAPPARDAMFRVQVLVRLEQARFKRRVARTFGVSAVLGLLAAVNAPLIEGWLAAAGQQVWIIAFAAAATMCVVPALIIAPRIRTIVRGVFARLIIP
jgi:membrane protein YdbS with pleckstrin-like domain